MRSKNVHHGPVSFGHCLCVDRQGQAWVRAARVESERSLRCRDLFLDGEDTSWYEIDEENGAVAAKALAPVRPEPIGGALFARVVHAEGRVTVSIVDLTWSLDGRWSEPTARGSISSVALTVLLDHPEKWRAVAAVLGAGGDCFTPLLAREVPHHRGRAVEVELPLVARWSVLHLERWKRSRRT